jgi:hypothetical protein
MRVPPIIGTNPGRALDEPQPKRERLSRPGQRPPVNVPGQPNRSTDGGSGGHHGPPAGNGDGDGDSSYRLRMEKRNDRWDERRPADVNALIAATPLLAEKQAARRAAQVQAMQYLIDSTEPLPCRPSDDSSLEPHRCSFQRTGSQAAVYHDIGGVVGRITVGLHRCSVHGQENVTVHPFQVGCVPTSPVINTIWPSLELVEQFRVLQLKDGVGGHGAQAAARKLPPASCRPQAAARKLPPASCA